MTLAVRDRALRALLALPLLAVPTALQASGFAIESQGSRAMGFAGAYVAQAADPSAIFYNAAGIGFLKGKQLYVGGAFAGRSTDFTGSGPYPPAGTLETSSNGLALLPSIYYSQQVGQKMVVGLGVSRPFGTRSEWQNPDDFTGRYICLECKIDSWSINPTIAYRLADRFSIGAGVDVRLSKFSLSRRLVADPNPFPVPTDVAQLTLDGNTETGVGFNLGLLAMPTENLSIGLSYRHEVTIDHGAQANLRCRSSPGTPCSTRQWRSRRRARSLRPSASPTRPASRQLSPGGLLDGRGRLPVDMWSSFDAVTINTSTRRPSTACCRRVAGHLARGDRRQYLIRDDWEVRAGYGYDHSPAPTETISPFIHDADRHTFGAGGSWKYENLRLDFNLRYVLFQTSSTLGISRYDYNGSYKSGSLQVGASFGYRF
jgi:long-chain fatty acid transport protein